MRTPSYKIDNLLFLAIFFIIMLPNLAATKSASEEPIIEISAADLWNAYKNNPDAADEQYKDKVVEVSGKLNGWLNGQPFFICEIEKITSPDGRLTHDRWKGIHCLMGGIEILNRSRAKNAYEKGNQVSLRGRCEGWDKDSNNSKDGTISVRILDCRFIK